MCAITVNTIIQKKPKRRINTVSGKWIYDWCMSSDTEIKDVADEWFEAKEECEFRQKLNYPLDYSSEVGEEYEFGIKFE